jgi:hypothetical protein
MDDVARLSHDSDFSRFVGAGVDVGVQRAAMKKLFSDPHFNVMDGLDTYIDDYGRPDPIPLSMLRQMNQSTVLGLFDHDEATDGGTANAATAAGPPSDNDPGAARQRGAITEDTPHDDADLRLQQDDVAGRAEPGESARA